MSVQDRYKKKFAATAERLTLAEYLSRAKEDSSYYLTPAERMLKAFGEPELVDVSKNERLNRIFFGRKIRVYKPFADFFGLEEVVDSIHSFLTHSAQGLEERKQILYLLGPVGGGKSSLAERLKELMEQEPFYAIEGSPIWDNPLSLFQPSDAEEIGIPARYLTGRISPWLTEKLKELDGDIFSLTVVKMYPDQHQRQAIAKTEPGDENTQDVSTLTGKVLLNKLVEFEEHHPYAYGYTGGLCRGNRGMLEFVEMFKAPIKVLHPLLTATQEGNYNPTEALPAIPFEGIILAHSNESEWESFKEDKKNEAFIDRVYVVKVPNCMRITDNIKILQKLIDTSSLSNAPIAPGTLDLLSKFMIYTRVHNPDNSDVMAKMLTYDGQNCKAKYPTAKTISEYRTPEIAAVEGMDGMSSRAAFKLISKVFNFDPTEIAADGVHMLWLMKQFILEQYSNSEYRDSCIRFVEKYLEKEYLDKVAGEIRTSFFDSHEGWAQATFDKYVLYADHWIQDHDFLDPETGQQYDLKSLNSYCDTIERPAGISNAKDFRHEVVNFVLRYRSENKGKTPNWSTYKKLSEVIEKNLLKNGEDLIMDIVSHSTHANKDDQKKYNVFLENMKKNGYTESQVKRIVSWLQKMRSKK